MVAHDGEINPLLPHGIQSLWRGSIVDSARVMKECRLNASGQGLDGGRSGVDIISARPDPDRVEKGEARAVQWRSICWRVQLKCQECGRESAARVED